MRIYYTGTAADGVRVIEAGGRTLVWSPKGCRAIKKKGPLLTPDGRKLESVHPVTGRTSTPMATVWSVALDSDGQPLPGPTDSFVEVSATEATIISLAKNNGDGLLVNEETYRRGMGADEIDRQIEALELEKSRRASASAQLRPSRQGRKAESAVAGS